MSIHSQINRKQKVACSHASCEFAVNANSRSELLGTVELMLEVGGC